MRNPDKQSLLVLLAGFVMLMACTVVVSATTAPTPASEQSATTSVETLLDQAQKALDAGELQRAEQKIDAALRQQPENVRGLYLLGVTRVRENAIQEGIEMIARAVRLAPENITYKVALASMYEFVGRIDKALELNRQILRLADPTSEEYRQARRNAGFQEATQLARSGELVRAEQQFGSLAERYPDDYMIRYSLGIAQMLQGKTGVAEKNLLKVTLLNPDFVNVYLSLAQLYQDQGHLDKSYAMLEKAVAAAPGSEAAAQAKMRMDLIEARLLLAEGNETDARDVLEKAYALAPDNPAVLLELSQLYEKEGNWEGVIRVSEPLTQTLLPERLDVSLRLARAYVNTERYDEAVTEMERLISVAPASAEADEARRQLQRLLSSTVGQTVISHQRNARIEELQQRLQSDADNKELLRELETLLIQQQRYQEAREPAEHLLELEPGDGINQTSMGLIYDKLGLFEKALEPYAVGISLQTDPELAARLVPALVMDVAKAAYTRGDLSLARDYLQRILEKEPGNIEARFYSGLVYYDQDETVRAVDAFQRVLQYFPGHIPARLNLAMSYHRLRREEDAIEEFHNALQYNPDPVLADKIRAQMQSVEKSIRGFSGGFSYAMAFDSNSNVDGTNPIKEYRTDLAPHLLYRYKTQNGLRWKLSTEPVYSSYHNGEFDFLNTHSTITASISKERITLTSGISYQVSRGLIDAERSSNATTYHGEWLGRYKLPQLLHLDEDNRVLTNLSLRGTYTDFDSLTSRFFSAYIYSVSLGFNQPAAERTLLGLSYNYTLSDNKYVVGSDYAYREHTINMRVERGIAAGVAVNAGGSYSLINYLHPDSVSEYTSFRQNHSQTLYAGVSYQFHPAIRLFANMSWSANSTNLPVGVVLNAQDVVESQQSPVLGDYRRLMITAGVAMDL
jgi:tetratricopeptide (TPR) repeat protein